MCGGGSSSEGKTKLLDEEGDECVSRLDLALWKVCLDVRDRYAADVIFTQAAPNHLQRTDGWVEFLVPRDHPQLAEMVRDLTQQLELIRLLLDQHHASHNLGWRPREFAVIRPYSGVAAASEKLEDTAALLASVFSSVDRRP